jgi:ribose-phosphate pyrophosphokinase|tara:strand:+ start:401 stop:1264 length:864 start_codon:yes stop_codon:yes gene_type:complete
VVIGGNSSQELARKIAKKLKAGYVNTSTRTFADGESKITIKKIPNKKIIVVVQSTFPPVDSNLLHLLSIISQAKKYSSKIYAVIPYLGYARQDREFLDGEIVTVSVVGKMLKSVGAKKVIVVDIHSKLALKQLRISSENVSAVSNLANYIKRLKLKDPLVVSPDEGGKERASKFANALKTDFIALKKHRDRKTGKINIITTKVSVKDRDLILVDDMISTGGSIIKATQFLKKQKCRRVYVACTHGLFVNGAEKKIKQAGVTLIISTNTIPTNSSKVDVSKIIAESLL